MEKYYEDTFSKTVRKLCEDVDHYKELALYWEEKYNDLEKKHGEFMNRAIQDSLSFVPRMLEVVSILKSNP